MAEGFDVAHAGQIRFQKSTITRHRGQATIYLRCQGITPPEYTYYNLKYWCPAFYLTSLFYATLNFLPH
jgi:hypothetical protein